MEETQDQKLLTEASEPTSTIDTRQQRQKQDIIDQLKKSPVVQIACEKAGVGRSTYYRWRQLDSEFCSATDKALNDGYLLVNDMAESQVMSAIKNGNLTGAIFWLRTHHPKYKNKMEVTASIKNVNEQLTPEQQAVVEQALKLASLIEADAQETLKENSNGKPNTNNQSTQLAEPANAGSKSGSATSDKSGNEQPAIK